MISGISTRSDDMTDSRAFSAARSGEPGKYARLGSLTGEDMGWTPADTRRLYD
jgi:hypothetical protein